MKYVKKYKLVSALALFSVFLVGCSQMLPTPEAETQPTELAPIVALSGTLAEGVVVPLDSVQLSFVASGTVEEVTIQVGDQVEKGDVLAYLANREQLEAVIASAEFELLSAQKAYETLTKDLSVVQNQALKEYNVARQAVRDAERKVSYLSTTASQADIDNASAQLVFAKKKLDEANEDFDPYRNKNEDNLVRARLQIAQAAAQKEYDDAKRRYNGLSGTANEFDLNQATTDLEIARNQFKIAEENYQLLLNGPDPDDLLLAQSRIDTAEAQLSSARANLSNIELKAPFSGSVVDMNLIPGQFVSPGEPVLRLADFSVWFVETDNLTELEVVDVSLGQAVTIVPDALPDVELTGTVVRINDFSEEKRGDTTYTVRIALDEIDPRMRWGMKVLCTFE